VRRHPQIDIALEEHLPGADYDGFALFEAPDDATAVAAEVADVAAVRLSRNRIVRILDCAREGCRRP
jgi:hypothetical protein